ncbi:metalloendopeptidase, partial [Coemansia sp. RSA 2702]
MATALQFDVDADEILVRSINMIAKERLLLDQIATAPPSFAETIKPLAELRNVHMSEFALIQFLGSITASQAVHAASLEAEKMIKEFNAESLARSDVFQAVQAVASNDDELELLCIEDRRLVEQMELESRRHGAHLDDSSAKQQLQTLTARLAELEQLFQQNIRETRARVLFTRGELAGLPPSFFRAREECRGGDDDDVKLVVTTDLGDYLTLMQHARLEATRRAMFLVHNTRCRGNVALLEEAVGLRREKARLLGFHTHAEYTLQPLMARGPHAAHAMLSELRTRLAELGTGELEQLEQLKQADMQAMGRVYEGFFEADRSYYAARQLQQTRRADDDECRGYFELAPVVQQILALFQELFAVSLAKQEGVRAWRPDVDVYEVREASALAGHIYVDLHCTAPRGPRVVAACLRPGYDCSDGTRQVPAAALVARFARPADSSVPVLLAHADVEALVRELGRAFQHVLCATKWAQFHSSRALEQDFVHVPAQTLARLAWNVEALQRISAHHRTGEPIPAALAGRLVAARPQGAALDHLRQVFLSLYDLAIHNADGESHDSVDELFDAMNASISLVPAGATRTFVVARLG